MCLISKGRGVGCRSGVGGVLDLYFFNHEEVPVFTFDAEEIITAMTALTVYHYRFYPGQVSFTEVITSSTENGTVFYDQQLVLNLHGQSPSDRIEINNMARGLTGVFVRDNEKKIRLMGIDGGAQVREGQGATGQLKGDRKGYSLTLGAEEATLANFLTQYSSVPFDNFPDVTVVEPV